MFYKIRAARESKGISQTELADLLGTSQTVVSRWERGVGDVKGETLQKIAMVTGVTINFLYGIEEPSPKLGTEESLLLRKYNALNTQDRRKIIDLCTALELIEGVN